MSTELSSGDPVQVTEREAVAADAKTGLFYPHYRGLVGTVAKVHSDGTTSVTVDPASLPVAMRARHDAGSEAQRRKWLDGLSDEARNRLTAVEKQFSLRYTILVDGGDLRKLDRKSTSDLDDAEERFLQTRQRKN